MASFIMKLFLLYLPDVQIIHVEKQLDKMLIILRSTWVVVIFYLTANKQSFCFKAYF